jgi:RNA polymerase sigma-70 factor (sigma-E family)
MDGELEQVWRSRRDHLWRIAWLICGDADLADDVLAAAVARTWRSWGRRDVLDPEAYLRRAVVNEATDRFRHRARDRRWRDRRTGEGRGQLCIDDEVVDRSTVATAIARLPAGQRAVIVLRFWADLSESATAEALAISPGTVKSRTSRALAALASDLAIDSGWGRDASFAQPPEASDV